MVGRQISRPTPTEVEILGILWERGPSTVRDVHDLLSRRKHIGYTGVLKLLQNMLEKRLVRRNETERAHVYAATESAAAKRQLLSELMQRAFGGSASQLVLHLLEDEIASPDEVEKIRQLVAVYRSKSK